MGLFDRKKKVREPEPLPGQPPISTSRPRQSLQKQNPTRQQDQQQQQQRGQQISDPILYDPNYQGQQGGGPFGTRSRGSVIQEERGGGGGGQQQWDPPQRSAGMRDSQFENQRNSVASDRDWTMISPQTGFAQATHPSQTSSPTSQLVPGSSPPVPQGLNSTFYDVPPGSIFPSHQLSPPIVPPPSGAHARYTTTSSNHSHNGSREDLPHRSSVVPTQPPPLVSPPPSTRQQGGGAPGSYDGSHDSSHGLSSGGRPEVTTPGSMREGSARFNRGPAESGSIRGDLDARDRQSSGDSLTPMRPPRAQPPPSSTNPMAQPPSSNSHPSIVNLTPSSPSPPPPPPPQIGQHAKVPSFSSLSNLQANVPPPVVTQIYDSPSYAAAPPSSRAQQQPPPPPPSAPTNIDHSRYSVVPTPPPPPPSGQQHPPHRSQDWSAAAQQQHQQSRLSHQPQPVSSIDSSSYPPPSAPLPQQHQQQQPYSSSNPTSFDNGRYSQQPPRQPNSDYVHYQSAASQPPTPLSSAGNGANWRPSIDQQSQPPIKKEKEKGEKKKFGFLPQWSGRSEVDGDDESTKSSKKILKKEAKERDREYAASDVGHGNGGNGNGMLPKGWKEEDVEDTIASLSHLPPHAFQSSSEHLAFTSQIDDLTHRLQNDPTNGTLAEKTARQLRKEIKNLPSEIEKEGAGASGSVAELWWKLMWTGDAKIMRLCSNQKFLSNLESSFKKLPSSCQQKVDLYHVFGIITETFRGSNGSEDLEKYFSKVYENANESGLNRSTPPQYLQALSSGQDRQRGRTDGQKERRHRSSGFPSSDNVPTVGDDLERMARECEGAWKTKEDLLQLLREARNDEGLMDDSEMRARIRESYQACFYIETELVNHRPWAESQATESLLTAPQQPQSKDGSLPSNIAAPLQPGGGPKLDQQPPVSPGLGLFQTEIKDTRAQIVLRRLMEVTAEVSESLEAFHEWEREMQEDEEMRIIEERSRKETRHDRSKPIQTTDNLLPLPTSQTASASRSPSPIRTPLWDDNQTTAHPKTSSPLLPPLPNLPNPTLNLSSKSIPIPLPAPPPPSSHNGEGFTPRSGSPDVLPPPPRGPNDPALIRSASPGSRPLPVPEKTKGKGFMGMLGSGGGGGRGAGVPVGNGGTGGGGGGGGNDGLEGMSEKARGKMRVIDAYEADDAFDPDDIYKTSDPIRNDRPSTPTSIHSSLFDEELADDWVPPKPITYVYDAALERKVFLEEERKREALRALKAKGRGSSYVEPAAGTNDDDEDARPAEQQQGREQSTLAAVEETTHGVTTGGGGRLEKEKEMGRMLGGGVGGTNANGNGNGHPMEKEHSGASGLGRKMSFWKKSGNRVASDGKEKE